MDNNQYIVGVYKWNSASNKYEHSTDGILKLFTNGKFTIINNGDTNTKLPVLTVLTDDFTENNTFVINNVKNINNAYDVEIITKNGKFGIRFDRSSSAAYNEFMKDYHKLKERINDATRYYESGKLKIFGDIVNGEFTGNCVEYHDNERNSIKYIGDMEDGDYDGSGEFLSECGLIKVCANNICGGVPNGTGKLFVCGKLIQIFKFQDYNKRVDTRDTNYCNKILQLVRKDHIAIYREGKFNALDADERVNYLFGVLADTCDELERTKSRLDEIEKSTKKSWKFFS